MKDLAGRVAFITGGGSGLGLGMARAFIEQGIAVAIADIMPDHLASARVALGETGRCHFIQLDVTNRAAFARAADEAEALLGPVSILCNNAGVGMLGSTQTTGYVDWDWVMSVNLGGVINGIQTFLPRMRTRGEGHIVNTSSIGGILPGPGGVAYLTAKAAVLGLSEAMLCDVRGEGIGVTVILLGPTASNIHKVAKQRPKLYSDSGLAAFEVEFGEKPIIAGGMDPLEGGRQVLKAIERDQLYLFTHPEFRHAVQQRFSAIMTAFGPDTGEPAATESHGFPTFNPLFAEIIANSGKN
jgi:NAD(P)-dependent dehydrogenase (short-subunit alcohol dehydrogenase family)